MATNPAELTFGVEIETGIQTQNCDFSIGPYHNGVVQQWLPIWEREDTNRGYWKAEHDSSIYMRNCIDCEFVSPVLKGAAGIDNLIEAVKKIKSKGAQINRTCGIHVTVGFDGDTSALARLVNLVARFETALYASSGTHHRQEGTYCRGIKQMSSLEPNTSRKAPFVIRRLSNGMYDSRYHIINLSHLARGGQRVEFRLFSGSLNHKKIVTWVWLSLALVQLALDGKRMLPWDCRATWPKGGEGEKAVELLLEKIGWSYTYNGEKGCVHTENTPSTKQAVAILRRLAKNYDDQD